MKWGEVEEKWVIFSNAAHYRLCAIAHGLREGCEYVSSTVIMILLSPFYLLALAMKPLAKGFAPACLPRISSVSQVLHCYGRALGPLRRTLGIVGGAFKAIHNTLDRWRIAAPLYFVLLGILSITAFPPTADEIEAVRAERNGGGGGHIALPRRASGKSKSGRLVANLLQRNGTLRRSKATKVPSIGLFRRSFIEGRYEIMDFPTEGRPAPPAPLKQQASPQR